MGIDKQNKMRYNEFVYCGTLVERALIARIEKELFINLVKFFTKIEIFLLFIVGISFISSTIHFLSLTSNYARAERTPASLQQRIGALHLNLDSNNILNDLETSLSKIRFEGEYSSPQNEKIVIMKLINKTNNVTATIFKKTEKSFFTDYLDLSLGPNLFEVEYTTDQKKVILESFKITKK